MGMMIVTAVLLFLNPGDRLFCIAVFDITHDGCRAVLCRVSLGVSMHLEKKGFKVKVEHRRFGSEHGALLIFGASFCDCLYCFSLVSSCKTSLSYIFCDGYHGHTPGEVSSAAGSSNTQYKATTRWRTRTSSIHHLAALRLVAHSSSLFNVKSFGLSSTCLGVLELCPSSASEESDIQS